MSILSKCFNKASKTETDDTSHNYVPHMIGCAGQPTTPTAQSIKKDNDLRACAAIIAKRMAAIKASSGTMMTMNEAQTLAKSIPYVGKLTVLPALQLLMGWGLVKHDPEWCVAPVHCSLSAAAQYHAIVRVTSPCSFCRVQASRVLHSELPGREPRGTAS